MADAKQRLGGLLRSDASQIASITGHASIAEVQRYTKAADRKRMAREAMARLVESES
jgi:integrase